MTEDLNGEQLYLKKTEGFMYKKGGAVNKGLGGRRNWLKRWFILEKTTTRGRTLYTLNYYESQKGKQKGSVDLEGTEIFCERRTQHTNKNVRYEFQIQLQNGSLLQLSCDDFKERDDWIESLNYAITSMRKPVVERPTFIKVAHAGYDPNLDDKEDNYELGEEIAQNCQAYGSGLYGAEAGQPAEFMIQVCNPEGKQLTTGGLPFTANLYDDTCLYHIGIHDKGNGTLSAFYVLSRPGKYELSIMLNDEHHIYGSPFNVEVLPSSTSPMNCVAVGDCIQKKIYPDVVSTFTIIAMDLYGNKKQRGGDPFEVGVMGPAKLLGLEDKGDGTYICSLEAFYPKDQPYLTTASITVMVTLHGKPIHDSPFRPSIDMTTRINSNLTGNRLQLNNNNNGIISNNNNNDQQRVPFSTPSNPLRNSQLNNSQLNRNQISLNDKNIPESIGNNQIQTRPPLEIPPGTNKLEAARLRALEAVKETPPTPQELVAIAIHGNNSNNSNNSNSNIGGRISQQQQQSQQQLQQNSSSLNNTNTNINARLGKIDQMMNNNNNSNTKSSISRTQPQSTTLNNTNNNNNINNSTSNNLPPKNSSTGNKLSTRMSKLDLMTQQLGTSKVFQPQGSNSSSGAPQLPLSNNNSRIAPPPQPNELMDSLSLGLVIPPPDDLPNELRRLWSITHEAFGSKDIIQLLATNAIALQSSFNLAAEPPSYRLAFLLSETGNSAGLYKLFEEFDVIPAYMNKKELKILFDMIVRSQSHSGPPPASFISSQGKEGIEFIYFMKLLLMVALFTLSKTQAFNSLYSTVKAKTDVMLFNWGFADPLKIRSIQDRL